MSDTQWPRFEVFQQEQPGRPHLGAGSVHAPDAELALLNARDVFVRRPPCVSLWVVPADAITGITAEAVTAGEWPESPETPGGPEEPYLVFLKRLARGTHEHAGEVLAGSPVEALRLAVDQAGAAPGLVYWVCPRRSLLASEAEDRASFFRPAEDKPYRDQAYYHTDSLLREVRRGSGTRPA